MAKIANCAEVLKHQRAGPEAVRRTGSLMSAARQAAPALCAPPDPAPVDAAGRGTVSQWIGPPGSRKADAALALLLAAAEDGLGCAWVEARAGFPCPSRRAPPGWFWHGTGLYAAYALSARAASSEKALLPCSPAARGFEGGPRFPRGDPRRRCMAAVQATVQLLSERRWAVVVLHLGGVPPAVLREMAPCLLIAMRELAGRSGTALVLLREGRALDRSSSSPDADASIVRFEPRELRSAHGLRRRPETRQGGRGMQRFRRGQGRPAKVPSQSAPAPIQAAVSGTTRLAQPHAPRPFLVR